MLLLNNLASFYLKEIKGLKSPRDIIKYSVKRNHNKDCIIEENKTYSYNEIYKRSLKLANSLTNLGLKRGDKLGVILYNCREYFEIRIACYFTGIVIIPLIWDFKIKDVIFILNDCGIKTLIYDKKIININKLEKNNIKYLIELNGEKENDYKNLINKGKLTKPNTLIYEDDVASINFSSGTTGKSKGVIITNKNWVDSFYNYVINFEDKNQKNIVMLHVLPFATAGGGAFLPVFFLGAQNIILNKFNPEKAISLIKKYKINTTFLTPSYLAEIMRYCKNKKIKINLKKIVLGTEPISPQKLMQIIKFFGPIIQYGYGMVEVLPPLTLLSQKDYINKSKLIEKRLSSTGRVLKGVKIKILKTNELGSEKIGKIVVKSSTVSKGYWNNPELTKKCYKKGWFYTDDYGYIDKEGYLYVCGRKQDIIMNLNGKIVFRKSIEEILNKSPAIFDAYVFLDNKKNIVACVSLRESFKRIKEKKIIEFCRKKLDKNLIPKKIIIMKNLPRNASGKIDANKIKKEFNTGKNG